MATKETTRVLSSAVIADLFKTGDVNDPGLRFENPPMSPEQKAEAAQMISAQRHSAKNLEELLEGGKLTSGQDYVNKAFTIETIEWRASDIAGEGLPFWALLTIVTAQGELKKIGVGARSVAEALAIGDVGGFFNDLAGFKQWVKFTAVALTDADGKLNGRTALELHVAEGPF